MDVLRDWWVIRMTQVSGCFGFFDSDAYAESLQLAAPLSLISSECCHRSLCRLREVTQGKPRTNHHTRGLWEGGEDRTRLLERKPKESSNGEPLGAGLQSIYTTIHEGCTRLSIGLCTVHDIIVELRARLLTSRVALCTARGTGLGYYRIRCADKILCTIR